MKSVLLLTAAIALLATPALAQTPTEPAPAATAASPAAVAAPAVEGCGAVPAAPALADVSTLKNAKEISAATDVLNAYLANAQANLMCRRSFIERERAAMLAKQEMLKVQTDSYNEDVRLITGVRDGWDAQVTAYNEKQKKSRR